MKMINKIYEHKTLIRQMFFYGLIGGICASLDAGVFYLLRKHTSFTVNMSNFISINLGILCSFLLNRSITFKQKDNTIKRASNFFLVGYIGLVISLFIFFIGRKTILSEITIKIISIVIVAIIQFILNKIITFRSIKNEKKCKN